MSFLSAVVVVVAVDVVVVPLVAAVVVVVAVGLQAVQYDLAVVVVVGYAYLQWFPVVLTFSLQTFASFHQHDCLSSCFLHPASRYGCSIVLFVMTKVGRVGLKSFVNVHQVLSYPLPSRGEKIL